MNGHINKAISVCMYYSKYCKQLRGAEKRYQFALKFKQNASGKMPIKTAVIKNKSLYNSYDDSF